MDDRIIPFGKYKGKPIEVLASDEEYLKWLLAQSFFKERHLNLYNVVVNNFREPVETPEHNKIQVKFLQREYRARLAYLLNPMLFKHDSKSINDAMVTILSGDNVSIGSHFLKALQYPFKHDIDEFGLYNRKMLRLSDPVFEKDADVFFNISYGIRFFYDNGTRNGDYTRFDHRTSCSFTIEIKPTIGDDFPAVLRQMKASMPKKSCERSGRYNILLVGQYTGLGASEEEFVQYFNSQGYWVVFEHQIESFNLPEFEEELILRKEIEEMIKWSSE